MIDLSRLNPKSFEHLIRAISLQHFGVSGTVFGPGRDGGRDFAIEGPITAYESKDWYGYLVLQSKYRETSNGDSDVEWLIGQLEKEYKVFIDEKSLRRIPEYYIIATNISLSGADGRGPRGSLATGGITKLTNYLKKWINNLGISDFDIWSGDKVIDILANYPDIRRSFAAWITPSDIMAKLLDDFEAREHNFAGSLRRSLKFQLRRDQFLQLKNSGDVSDLKIRLSQVFMDLPLSNHYKNELGQLKIRQGALSYLVELARMRLGPASLGLDAQERDTPHQNKIVLLGGPGQGKSTLSLYFAQLLRANLVSLDPSAKYDPNVNHLASEVIRRAGEQMVSTQVPARYPFYISLPSFADEISRARKAGRNLPTVLSWLAKKIPNADTNSLSIDDLRAWIANNPTVSIFDGLDEVPPSGERSAVIDAISDYITEATDGSVDTLFLVTTRPQGYNDDFSPNTWQHVHLDDLSSKEALNYASAIGSAKYPTDPDRANKTLASLQKAGDNLATQRLMTSPLQTTILFLIADTGAGIPAARWTLFATYFDVLVKREKSKGGEIGEIVERNLTHLNPIHERVGLLLHVRSEKSGNAAAYLTETEFTKLCSRYLETEGFNQTDLDARVAELSTLVVQRLVLLTEKEEGRITFDVRTLQEFMAASALTSGSPQHIENRLRGIVGRSHWGHVFLICASRIFSDSALLYLRSNILSIAREADTGELDGLISTGARTALEMFRDGIAADNPRFRLMLAAHALELLEYNFGSLAEELSILVEKSTYVCVKECLSKAIKRDFGWSLNPAIRVLSALAGRDDELSTQLILETWPSGRNSSEFICALDIKPASEVIRKTLSKELMKIRDVEFMSSRLDKEFSDRKHNSNFVGYDRVLGPCFDIKFGQRSHEITILGYESLRIRYSSLFDEHAESSILGFADELFNNDNWKTLHRAGLFEKKPTKESLAAFFEACIQNGEINQLKAISRIFSWPIASLLQTCEDKDGLIQLRKDSALGLFGDTDDWKAAEIRWNKKGLSRDDFLLLSNFWFNGKVKKLGCPSVENFSVTNNSVSPDIVSSLIDMANEISNPVKQKSIRDLASFSLVGAKRKEFLALEKDKIIDMLQSLISSAYIQEALPIISSHVLSSLDSSGIMTELLQKTVDVHFWNDEDIDRDLFVATFNTNLDYRSLIPLIALTSFRSHRPNLLLELDQSAFMEQSDDPDIVLSGIWTLQILMDGFDKNRAAANLATSASEGVKTSEIFLNYLCYISRAHRIDIDISILSNIYKIVNDGNERVAIILGAELKRILDRRSSALFEGGRWVERYNLPEECADFVEKQ